MSVNVAFKSSVSGVGADGRTCTTTFHAATLEGAVTDIVATRQLF